MRARGLSVRRALLTACSVAAVACPPAAFAQESVGQPPAPDNRDNSDNPTVIVYGRAIVSSLANVPVEQVYDEQGIASYAASTVGELLGEIRDENGDSDPAILINGQPVADVDNIADLPVEALARVETLARGAAQRVNGAPGQRVYNIVLRTSVKSATLTASREVATEGGWSNSKGEGLLNYIHGQDRIGLTVRAAKSGNLFESERDFTPRTLTTPYSANGNIIPASGTEVDPLLSALVGRPVTSVALPAGQSLPTLASLVPGANHLNPSDESLFRTLRGASNPYEAAIAGSKQLKPWLSLQANARATWSKSEFFNGLPSARFLIPASNPFTPFSVPVTLALNDPTRPLQSRNSLRSQSLSSALNATLGSWRATLTGRWDSRQQCYVSEFTGPLLGGSGTVGATTNPFDGSLASLIPVGSRESRSTNSVTQFTLDAEGPLFNAWAGPVRARVGAGASWLRYDATDFSGPRSFDRHEYLGKVGISVPLTDRQAGFLPMLGDSLVAIDVGRGDLGRFGTLTRDSISFEWQPVDWLRFVASAERNDQAIPAELLAAPVVVNVNVPYFDPQTGQTVDVTTISGGAGGLSNEQLRSRSLALTATPWRKVNLQLDAEYIADAIRNQIGALPLPSPAIVAAFPDRFQRDSSGTLVLVDNRSVNFAGRDTKRVRFGLRFMFPLSHAASLPPRGAPPRRRIPPLRLQVSASQTIILKSRLTIRDGLSPIDLLDGGAIGIAGGQQRNSTDASVALTRGASGVRLEVRRRGISSLATGTPTDPDLLTFGPLTTIDLKAFADLGQLFGPGRLLKSTRVTFGVVNLANRRQRVTDLAGDIPQAYQPVRRDPVGRTVMIELRKVF